MRYTFVKLIVIQILIYFSIASLQALGDEDCLFESCNCTNSIKDGFKITCDNIQGASAFPTRNFSSSITNITNLVIRNYRFDQIPDGIFENLTIYILEFDQNGLQTIGVNAFKGMVSMTRLILHEPNLQTIASGALAPVYNPLVSVDLSRSQLTNQRFNVLNEEIQKVRSLLSLYLNDNNLTKIEKSMLPGGVYGILDFSSNQITQVDPDAFDNIIIYFELKLSNNRLSDAGSIIGSSRYLRDLDLSTNLIENIDVLTTINFTVLSELKLGNNRIKKVVNKTFTGLRRLLLLDLQSNQIDTIEPGAFDYLDDLSYLSLANNYIAKLPSFLNLLKLNSLRFNNQNNKLKRLEDYTFDRTNETYLLQVDMGGNDIELYGDKTFCSHGYDFAKITKLSLSYKSMKNLHKCVLKQLRPGFRCEIVVGQAPSSDISDVCTCDLYAFAKNVGLEITGACDPIFIGPTCQNTTFVDPCVGLDQFQCPIVNPTTTRMTTTTGTSRRPVTTSSAVKLNTKLSFFVYLLLASHFAFYFKF